MITITKDKIYRSPYSLKKTEADSKKIENLEPGDIVGFMNDGVEFGEDLTFGDLFDIIVYNKGFFNVLFNSSMGGFLVDDFIMDYENKFKTKYKDEKYVLRLSWVCDIYEFNNQVEYYDYLSFEGYGTLSKKDKEKYAIGIAFTSLSELRNKNITINNEFEIQNTNDYEEDSDIEAILKANYRPVTLYQAISSILSEISFYGSPDDRESHKKELDKENKDIERWIDEEGDKGETREWEDFSQEIGDMVMGEFDVENVTMFWDVLYPKKESSSETKKTKIELLEDIQSTMITVAEGSGISLEEQMKEAEEEEDYEKAAEFKKLIEKRDNK